MLLMLSVAVPLLVRVTAWAELELPTGTVENVRFVGVNTTLRLVPVPERLTMCGLPGASSVTVTVPVRVPVVVGLN